MAVYVVTGGAGFIGSHLAEHLIRAGHTVRVVDNLLTGRQAHLDLLASLNGDYSYYPVSVTDLDTLRPVFTDADVVFHQAALPSVPRSLADPLETHANTLSGTLKVLIAARDAGVRRVVCAASSAAYGDQPAPHHEGLPTAPLSPYGAAKVASEAYCQSFAASTQLQTVALRYFNVYGPRQDPQSEYAAVIPKFITRMLRGESPTIYGDGRQRRDFIYVGDIVRGNLLAAEAPRANGQVINLATGSAIDLLELVATINTILGTDIAPEFAPARAGDILYSHADAARAMELLAFGPRTTFEDGLRQTIDAFRA